jgi:hypothetical protein
MFFLIGLIKFYTNKIKNPNINENKATASVNANPSIAV